jgi:hypothetical protein
VNDFLPEVGMGLDVLYPDYSVTESLDDVMDPENSRSFGKARSFWTTEDARTLNPQRYRGNPFPNVNTLLGEPKPGELLY